MFRNGDKLVQNEHCDDRGDPVDQGNGDVRHGDAGKFGDQQGDNEFEGLHFSDLAFSHQSEHDEQGGKRDHGTYENDQHTFNMFFRQRIMPFTGEMPIGAG